MKVHCPISGISFDVPFPELGHATYPHPMLSMSAKDLTATYLETHMAQFMESELTHLLGLAYICKLPIVSLPSLESDSHVKLHAFWLKNMERLARLANSLEGSQAQKGMPKVRVSTDNLSNLEHWITDINSAWAARSMPISEQARKLNSQGHKSIIIESRDTSRNPSMYDKEEIDSLILRGLKGSPLNKKETKAFPELITKWVMNVAPFPTAKVRTPSGKLTTISQHWKDILETAFSKDGALDLLCEDVNVGDLEEILEHCYENIPIQCGTIASLLWKKLEDVKSILEDFRSPMVPQPKPVKLPAFKGTTDDLLSLLEDTPSEKVETPSNMTGLSLQEKLALKLRK